MPAAAGPLHWVLVHWETGGVGIDGQAETVLHYLSSHDQAAVESLAAMWVDRHLHPELPCMVTYLGPSELPLQPPQAGA
jgi:hypothetical protein